MAMNHAKALFFLARKEYDAALELWDYNLQHKLSEHDYNANLRWKSICLYKKGLLSDAIILLEQSKAHAEGINFERAVVSASIYLATIDLEQGDLESAGTRLAGLSDKVKDIDDRMAIAETHALSAKFHVLKGDVDIAITEMKMALDLFVRLGLGDERSEAEHYLEYIQTLSQTSEGI